MPSKRSQEDIDRDIKTYQEIFKLSGYYISNISLRLKDKEKTKILKSELTERWNFKGDDGKVKFIGRLLDYFKPENKNNKSLPELHRSRLIDILIGIQKYRKKQRKVLSRKEIIRILQKHGELTREEKKKLSIPIDTKSFIEQNSFNELAYLEPTNNSSGKKTFVDYDCENKENLEQLITIVIQSELQNELLAKDKKFIEKILEKLTEHISLIKVQSGFKNISQLDNFINNKKKFKQASDKIKNQLLTTDFLKKLILNIVDSQKLSEIFGLELEHIEVRKQEFIPVESKDSNEIVNQHLLKYDDSSEVIKEQISVFKNRHIYIVKIEFSLQIENNKIFFTEEVKGTSSILSLIRKALNRAIFWDIKCLEKFFPVVQEVFLEEKLYGGDTLANSWTSSRIRAVELKDLQDLLKEDKFGECPVIDSNNKNNAEEPHNNQDSDNDSYCLHEADFECYIEGSDIVEGSFCGFDLIESIALSGFYARLKLLQELNIKPKVYNDNLKKRIAEQNHLYEGQKYISSYPFSLLVMEDHFKTNILIKNNYLDESGKLKPEKCSNIAYQAMFDIIKGYLTEGLYNTAGSKLDELKNHLKYFNHFSKADYYICRAEHAFISEKESENDSRKENIDSCINYLKCAENELKLRTLEFFRIGELSLGNLSPFFSYWARISTIKGRLNLFFPGRLKKEKSITELISTLTYFGNARINSAMDGNTYLVSQVAAYQSWAYIIQAYLGDNYEGLGKNECIAWAKKLVNHALIGFQTASNEAYQDYMQVLFKEYKKIEGNYRKIGNIEIRKPPFFRLIAEYQPQESTSKSTKAEDNRQSKEIEIESKLINRIPIHSQDKNIPNRTWTLFGQHSAHYFFAYGMTKLCDNYIENSSITEMAIREKFKTAFDYFYYAFSIAYGGAVLHKSKDKIDRNTEPLISSNIFGENGFIIDRSNVSSLKGLYFHRIAELVDLSRIFASLAVSIIAQNEVQLEIGRKLLSNKEPSGIITVVPDDFKQLTNGQKYYNIHLKERFNITKSYLLDNCLKQMNDSSNTESLLSCRDKRIKKVFQKLRGD